MQNSVEYKFQFHISETKRATGDQLVSKQPGKIPKEKIPPKKTEINSKEFFKKEEKKSPPKNRNKFQGIFLKRNKKIRSFGSQGEFFWIFG